MIRGFLLQDRISFRCAYKMDCSVFEGICRGSYVVLGRVHEGDPCFSKSTNEYGSTLYVELRLVGMSSKD